MTKRVFVSVSGGVVGDVFVPTATDGTYTVIDWESIEHEPEKTWHRLDDERKRSLIVGDRFRDSQIFLDTCWHIGYVNDGQSEARQKPETKPLVVMMIRDANRRRTNGATCKSWRRTSRTAPFFFREAGASSCSGNSSISASRRMTTSVTLWFGCCRGWRSRDLSYPKFIGYRRSKVLA